MCANYVSWIKLHIDLHQNYGANPYLEHTSFERHVTTNHQKLLEQGTNIIVVSMANITSQNEWEKNKKVPEIEELNMLIVAMHFKWIHY